ncbi:MAG: InlB B-repeat-containing protein, partial [Treponema sp.]
YKSNAVKTKYYKVLKQHTVTFDANGGTYTGGTTYTALVAHTMTATAPASAANPTRTGYTFGSWYKEAACTTQWNFATDTVTGDITLYAQWNPASGTEYKVKHYQENLDGTYPSTPTDIESRTGQTDHTFTAAEINGMKKTTYQGFEFDKQEPAYPSIAADGSTVVKVYYKRKSITVTFNLNGGNIGGSTANVTRTGRFGTMFTAPTNPVKTGYTFGSWSPSSGSPALSSPSTFPASDATYTAQWVANTNTPYKVKHFKQNITDNEYTEVVADRQTLQGTTDAAPTVPLKTYTGFQAGSYTPTTIAADGSTVIAVKYNRKVYTVTFNANGGTPAPSNPSVRYEGKVTAPSTLTKQGYDFDKWYKDPSFTNEWNFATDTVTGDTTLYAKWNPRTDTQYTVKHLKQDVTGSGYTEVAADSQTLQGTTGAAPAVPLKTYTGFQAGTYTSATIAADGSTVIEVRYNRKVYTVTFNANGGSSAPSNQPVRHGGKVTEPSTMSKTGYTFGGWYKSYNYTGAAWNFASNTITADITLYAKWNPRNDTQYIVKHLKQDVTGSGYTEVAADRQTLQGTTDAAPTVTPKTTYQGFKPGTYTSTTIAGNGSTVVEVKYDRMQYTVSFNANGGTPAPQSQNVRYEGKVSTPSTISKTGYTFGGWYKSYNYTGTAWNFASDQVISYTNLYAKWTANTYKVHFDGNGHTGGSMPDQTFTYDEASKPLSQNTFTKTDYRFTGWTTSSSGSKMYDNQQSVNNLTTTNGGVVNLYAVWVPLPKVRFKVEGGKGGKLQCTYDGITKEASGNTENSFIVEYSTTKSAVFTAVPDSGWALAEWYINPGPFNDGSQSTALERAVTLIVSDVTVTVKFRH